MIKKSIRNNVISSILILLLNSGIDADPSGIISDDFNLPQLDTSLWTVTDSRNDVEVSVEGAGTGDAKLHLSVPAGLSHVPNETNTAPHIMQTINNEDFMVEVKFDSIPSQDYQSQGIIVKGNANHFLCFDTYRDNSGEYLSSTQIANGGTTNKINKAVPLSSPLYLRVKRVGDTWSQYYSNNGLEWQLAGSYSHAMNVTAIGPFVGNGNGSSAPAYTSVIDYFFNSANPIDPEDGGNSSITYTLATSVNGQGSVSTKPSGDVFPQGRQVQLTASPHEGWEFTGWSGDINESATPVTVTMNSDMNITAIFELITSTDPPVISNITSTPSSNSVLVSWSTDQPTTGTVNYGTTTSYELGSVNVDQSMSNHSVTLPDLSPSTEYHFEITATNANNLDTDSGDQVVTTSAAQDPSAPDIDIWYGSSQSFGQIGTPQRWVNILGNVSDPDGIQSLSYSLNGGQQNSLTVGSDGLRLENAGDFNIEISTTDLNVGVNVVEIQARDNSGKLSTDSVNVNFASSNTWPQTYTVDWNTVTNIQNVAQVVDGDWEISGGAVRSVSPGYDRLIAIGDIDWENYQVTVPITVHSIDYVGANPSAAGIILRWQGHVADGQQPSEQWYPLGIIGWYRWYGGPSAGNFELYNYNSNPPGNRVSDTSGMKVALGTTYIHKIQVQTIGSVSRYKYKVWQQGSQEPTSWLLSYDDPSSVDLGTGSLLLVSHKADASFGKVTITPL